MMIAKIFDREKRPRAPSVPQVTVNVFKTFYGLKFYTSKLRVLRRPTGNHNSPGRRASDFVSPGVPYIHELNKKHFKTVILCIL